MDINKVTEDSKKEELYKGFENENYKSKIGKKVIRTNPFKD